MDINECISEVTVNGVRFVRADPPAPKQTPGQAASEAMVRRVGPTAICIAYGGKGFTFGSSVGIDADVSFIRSIVAAAIDAERRAERERIIAFADASGYTRKDHVMMLEEE